MNRQLTQTPGHIKRPGIINFDSFSRWSDEPEAVRAKAERAFGLLKEIAGEHEGVAERVCARVIAELPHCQTSVLHGARPTTSRMWGRLSWLLGKRARRDDWQAEVDEQPLGFDHRTAWVLPDGTRVAHGQPYGISCEQFDELVRLRERGVRIQIDAESTWFPGRTVNVLVFSPCRKTPQQRIDAEAAA